VTGVVYDPLFLEHGIPGHPESPARLESIRTELQRAGLWARLTPVTSHPVDLDLLGRVHARAYIDQVAAISARGGGYLDSDTYLVRETYDAARLAAGGSAELVRSILSGRGQNGIALVRPPGHHAERRRGMGFCIFNNIAVAAQAALDEFGLQRVLIFDWDVHHGNGTQDIFYDSPNVLFVSTHQYPHYPGTGDWREAGAGAGAGFTLNMPLPAGVGDAGFARLLTDVVTPLAERFRPELILVSAGYDAHWRDPLAGLHLSLGGYWHLASGLVELAGRLCGGRIAVFLEGGYDLKVLSLGVADTCRALLGDAERGEDPIGTSQWPEPSLDRLIAALLKTHDL
jgi:acetoin utilization deacetylase AcuC-like enzyme